MTATKAIQQPITGLVRVGPHGQTSEFDRVGVFPTDGNGLVFIGITGGVKPVYLTLTAEQARNLAGLILERTQ